MFVKIPLSSTLENLLLTVRYFQCVKILNWSNHRLLGYKKPYVFVDPSLPLWAQLQSLLNQFLRNMIQNIVFGIVLRKQNM